MDSPGHSTSSALSVLLKELETCLSSCDAKRSTLTWLKEALHPASQVSLFRVTSATFSLAQALALILAYCITGESSLLLATLVILLLTGFNLLLTCWESYLRSVEMFARAGRITANVRDAREEARWGAVSYPHLHTPPADSIMLEWTIRDGEIVNLPWALLVRDDVVLLKPGQASPSKCRLLNDDISLTLEQGDTFHTDHMKQGEKSLLPEFKSSVAPQRFLVEQSPFVEELREMLLTAHRKPLDKFHKQRYFLVTGMLEHIALPATAIIALVWNLFRHHQGWKWLPVLETQRVEYFLKEPVTATLPLAPLVLPIWWILSSHASLATILLLFAKSSPTARSTQDPFDDTVETPEMEESVPDGGVPWTSIFQCFLGIVQGKGEYLARTENLLHALGSVSAFCCTDKKGILSWPNTSPEKIYFLRKSETKPVGEVSVDEGLGETHRKPRYHQNGVTPEILTVTHDPFSPFRVEFDDPHWKTHLSSLKPLGLSILLNTCNLKTEEKYTEFYNYLLCESTRGSLREGDGTLREGSSGLVDLPDLLPIAARGCLCELSSRIGISQSVVSKFTLEQQLQTFRPVVTDTPGADSLSKKLSVAKLKFPFPHMVSLVAQDNTQGRMQLITQGTADIVLDSCVDAWTGSDLTPLSEELRKRVMEFYHRASLTSYCSAFSYRPVSYRLPWSDGDHTYLELPPNSDPFFSQCRTSRSQESVDRISLGDETTGRCNSPDSGVEAEYQNVFTCLESQCNQSFVGMVQMQYEARVDMVQFIDLLEKACIRFVHFSRENELRSRVFSEKMGLESGWNCHISLRGELDLRENAKLMYSRRWITKQFSAENPNLKSHLNTSLPTKLDPDARTVDFPKWGDLTSRPLLTRQEEIDLSTGCLSDGGESGSVSTSSMLQYEMTNRAQLPCGIEKIRPHLEQMDNVPLLVSLFTDCTPSTTKEMVGIMQDYGEVVVMTGSSANYRNIRVFLASDASLAIEPLYPQVCQHVPVYLPPVTGPSPVDLAQQLTSLASSMSIKRDDEVSLMSLLISCRHYAWSIQQTLQFWVSVSIFLSVVVMLSVAICLPSPISPSQMLLIITVYLPALATANVMSARDGNMRSISTGKNCKVEASWAMVRYVSWCYGLRFLPALAAITLANFLCVFHYSDVVVKGVKSDNETNVTDGIEEGRSVEDIQCINMTFLTVYIALSALTFVSRTSQLWQLKLRRSWQMLLVCGLLVGVQCIYLAACPGVGALVPIAGWLVYVGAIPLIVVLNEIVKRQEIKVNIRFQKRARLEFGTKLGINSPF